MQNTVGKAFEGNASVVTLAYNQGGPQGEDMDWFRTMWTKHFLRASAVMDYNRDSDQTFVAQNYPNLDTGGLPADQGFVIGPEGLIRHAYVGFDPQEVISRIEEVLAETRNQPGQALPPGVVGLLLGR